ncbi:MAG: GDP-mannose 4,6-dehydratase, partial [Candidatus Aenigmatarchaeota archaeon]
IRPIWFYGPYLPEKTIFLIRMIKTGKPLMFGKGDALKSMAYIDNVVDALLLAEKQKVAEGETYLIADKKVYTVKELYEEIAKNLGVGFNPRFLPLILSRIFEKLVIIMNKMGFHAGKIFSAGEISRDVFYSIEKAERELGYKPKIGLKEGIKKTIEWCRENEVL